jgi:hypothetical protein
MQLFIIEIFFKKIAINIYTIIYNRKIKKSKKTSINIYIIINNIKIENSQ